MEARSKGLILPTNLVRSSLLLNHIEKGHSEEPLCPFSICNPLMYYCTICTVFSWKNWRISSALMPAFLAANNKCTHSWSRSINCCSLLLPWLDFSKKSPLRFYVPRQSGCHSISTLDPRLCAPAFRQVYLLLDPFHERICLKNYNITICNNIIQKESGKVCRFLVTFYFKNEK